MKFRTAIALRSPTSRRRRRSLTRWNTLKIDHRRMTTSLEGVFAAGDIVRGASLVVWAVKDGRDVAEQIHHYIRAKTAGRTTAPAAAAE